MMDLSQLASLFTGGSSEQGDAFSSVNDQLERIAAAVDAHEAAHRRGELGVVRSKLDELKYELENVDASSLLEVQESLPYFSRSRFRRFRKDMTNALAELKEDAGQRVPALDQWPTRLASCSSSLQHWQNRAVKSRGRIGLMARMVSLVALVGAPIFIFFQFRLGEIEVEALSMFFPAGPYAQVDTGDSQESTATVPTLSALPEDSDAYMKEFSEFYFGQSSTFGKRFLVSALNEERETRDDNGTSYNPERDAADAGQLAYRWKVLLQNTSLRRPEYISSVGTTVELVTPRAFPWDRLDAQPAVSLDCKNQSAFASVRNTAIASAFNLSWRIETPFGEVVDEGRHWILGKDEYFLPLTRESEQWGVLRLHQRHPRAANGEKGPFISELFDATPNLPMALKREDFETIQEVDPRRPYVTVDGKAYGKVWKLGQLEAVTQVLRPQQLKVTLTYESIFGDETTLTCEANPGDFVWYRRTERLSDAHPLSDRINGSEPYSEYAARAVASSPGYATYAALAHAFTPPESESSAADQLTASVNVDLAMFGSDHRGSAIHQIDRFLAPNGRIAFYTEASGMRSGDYLVRIDANGRQVSQFHVAVVVPDVLKFPIDPQDQQEEVRRVRTAIGRPVDDTDPGPLDYELSPSPYDEQRPLWQDMSYYLQNGPAP